MSELVDLDKTMELRLSARDAGFERLSGRPIGEILVALGVCTDDDINLALDAQAAKPEERLGQLLVSLKRATVKDVARALGIQLEMPLIDSIQVELIPDEFVQAIPIAFAKHNTLLPIGKLGDSVITAVANPLLTEALDDVALLLGARISPVIALPEVVTEAINRAYDRATGLAHEAVQQLQSDDDEDGDLDAIDLIDEAGSDDAPIIRFVNALLRDAVKIRASDIHIECYERSVVVRNRIDGLLYKKVEAPKQAQSSVIARVKIMSGLNIAEKRLPQDGRIRRKIAGKDIDVRVSTIPTAHGERVVMRILDRSSVLLSLEDLGFERDTYANIINLIERPHGIILVSGPTGSGKTTTLYAALSKINKPDINILTVEDPVEYQLPGIGQMQVQSKIDLTFASGLRAFLRQDPDVIMVGEIRDRETAEIAIQASLTGHLVLSTVHTNDAPGAITRLVDMGIEPFLVASSLVGVLAQRLVRTLCKQCKEPYTPSYEELHKIGLKAQPGDTYFREKGCAACLGTGYSGRAGIYELLLVTEQIRSLVLKNVDAGTIRRAGMAAGMKTLLDDGGRRVRLGHTTAEEVLRVATDEEIVVEV
jgi:general secretion pathway protein E